jgi:hypothetical protein
VPTTYCERSPIEKGTVFVAFSAKQKRYDSVLLDLRLGNDSGPIQETKRIQDPEQIFESFPDLPLGSWTVVAMYYKTIWDSSVTPARVLRTQHKVAVDRDFVSSEYDPKCDCYDGDNAYLDLMLETE